MLLRILLSFFVLLIFSCNLKEKKSLITSSFQQKDNPNAIINPHATTIKTRFNTPAGYHRIPAVVGSFASYLQNFKLKPHNTQVHLFDGTLKNRQDIHAGVLDIDVGTRDLQQCADATMRLRAEYLYQTKQYDKIHFNFTNGFLASYSKWRSGYRIQVKGNTVKWTPTHKESKNYTSFRNYLWMVFSYAGTLSLENELASKNIETLEIGDVFIQGGSPGHAIIVVDMAENKTGEKLFMLAQSYMPAQEIHILKNLKNKKISPWYKLNGLETLNTPEWVFTDKDVKCF